MSTPPPGYPGYPLPGYGPPGYPPPGYPAYSPGYPSPGYPPPGYPPPGYPQPGYAPSGYPPPGYPQSGCPQSGYAPPGYPPSAYGAAPPPLIPPAEKPGIIPLRPLSLSDIFNGAVGYIRANPAATLGLAAIVVVIARLVMLAIEAGPLAAVNRWTTDSSSTDLTGRDLAAGALSAVGGTIATSLSTIVLTGMLTVVIGRAVFGSSITIGEAWAKARGRLPALIGLAALMAAGGVALIGVVALVLIAAGAAGGVAAAVVVAIPLVFVLLAVVCYLYPMLSFAGTAIVLEHLGVIAAIKRSFALVRGDFWRVFGILMLTAVVTSFVTAALGFPFSIAGMMLEQGAHSLGPLPVSSLVTSVGTAIGEIVVEPFTAGVIVLLYTDRRVRAEAFDLVLRSGAAGGRVATESTDSLWLTRAA